MKKDSELSSYENILSFKKQFKNCFEFSSEECDDEGWPEWNDGVLYHDQISEKKFQVQNLIDFYSARYKQSASRKGWLQRINCGQISIDGMVTTSPDTIIQPGSILSYYRKPWKEDHAPYHVAVIYEDSHILVVAKPAGLQVMKGGCFHQRTLISLIHNHHQSQHQHQHLLSSNSQQSASSSSSSFSSSSPSLSSSSSSSSSNLTLPSPPPLPPPPCFIFSPPSTFSSEEWIPAPVHRLGRGTSGIVLCAKSPFAKSFFSSLFAFKTESEMKNTLTTGNEKRKRRKNKFDLNESVHVISKTYRALLTGIITEDTFNVNKPIGKKLYDGLVSEGLYMAVDDGKPSYSAFRVLWRDHSNNTTLVEVDLGTGRPHQIRIHSAFYGNPLYGDPLYGQGGIPHLFLSQKNDNKTDEKMNNLDHNNNNDDDSNNNGNDEMKIEINDQMDKHMQSTHFFNDHDNKLDDDGKKDEEKEKKEKEKEDDDVEEDGGHSRSPHALPGDCGYFLHSFRLKMFHPIKNKILEFSSFPPAPLRLPSESNEHFLPLWKEF